MGLLAHGDVAAKVCVILVSSKEVVLADEDLPQPLEDLGVVEDLVLDQLLRDREEHLRTGRREAKG